MSVLNVSTYILTSITAQPTGLAVILRTMSVSTFITAVIQYVQLLWCYCFFYQAYSICLLYSL